MKNFIESIVLNVKIIVAIIMDSLGLEMKTYAGGITTTELVNRIYNFCEVYSGRVMYPYQGQFSKRIIRSVLENDGAELTALFSRQSGKCFAKDTEILMIDGSRKKVQDIKVGDYVMTPDSKGARVTALGRGREEMYEVKSRIKNYESFVVNKSHILSLVTRENTIVSMTVEDYLKEPEWKKKDYYRGYRVGVEYPFRPTEVEPYFLGLWLGDGSNSDVRITTMESEVINYLEDYANRLGLSLRVYAERGKANSYAITNGNRKYKVTNQLRTYLTQNLYGNKHIPESYLNNSREVRLKLLAGLIDSDGYKSNARGKENTLEISFSVKRLADDTVILLRSLGYSASVVKKIVVLNGKEFETYRISAYGDFSCVPNIVERKIYKKCKLRENPLTFGFDLIPKGVDDYYGFTIDSDDRLFLLGDYTVTHNTETVAITVGGLMIILPQLANMPMFLNDRRLMMFKDGLWVGIFAPSQRQAQTTYGRMKSRMQCKEAQAVLNDPDFRLVFTTSNGQTVALSNGSFCTAISASDGSNIEGESFKFIILEECFVKGTPILTESGYKCIENISKGDSVYSYNHSLNKVELKRVQRSFSQPLYNRKLVKIKTNTGKEIVCTDNHKIFKSDIGSYVRADSLQVHDLMLLYVYNTQEEVTLNNVESDDTRNNARGWMSSISRQEVFKKSKIGYKSFFKTGRLCLEKVRKGISPLFTRTQNSSKSWKRNSALQIYYKMFRRIETLLRYVLQRRKETYRNRHLKPNERGSTSLLVSRRRKYEWDDEHSYTRILNGRERIVGTMVDQKLRNHSFNTYRQEDKQTLPTIQRGGEEQVSKNGSSLYGSLNDVQNTSYRYSKTLCGVWETDSTLSPKECGVMFREMSEDSLQNLYEGVLQEEEIVSIEIKVVDEVEVYDLTVEDNHNFFANGLLVHNCQDISNYKIRKSVHPMGAAYNATICKIGTATTFKGDFYEAIQRNKQFIKDNPTLVRNHFEYDCDVVARFNPKYAKYLEREKRSLGESSDEYRMSYKLEWIISRGMFVDIQKVEKECGDEYLGRVPRDMQATHVVGIDVGGGSSSNKRYADSTVITVVEVNWNEPILMEKVTDEETGEDIVYTAYNTYIKDWYEISPEIAENYEEQYHLIKDYLQNFNVVRVMVDATREASLAQRLQANLRCEVVPFVFSSKSKSDIYKHLQIEINTGRARFPRDKETVETKEYKKFTQQLADLQKGYSGSHLVVSHPDEKGAHDDYPDSWCLAVWGTKDQGYVDNTETLNRGEVLNVHKNTSVFGSKNRFTARRR